MNPWLIANKFGGFDPKFSLPVRDPWLSYIQSGKKTVEGRTGHENKYKNWIDKEVIFFNKSKQVPVKVKAVRHYPDLYSYLDAEGYEKVHPGSKSLEQTVNAYHEFYSDEKIKLAGGMVAIEVELSG